MPRELASKRTSDATTADTASSKRRATVSSAAKANTTVVVNEHLLHQTAGLGAEIVTPMKKTLRSTMRPPN